MDKLIKTIWNKYSFKPEKSANKPIILEYGFEAAIIEYNSKCKCKGKVIPDHKIYTIEYFLGYESFPIGMIESTLTEAEFNKEMADWNDRNNRHWDEFPDISEVFEVIKKADSSARIYKEPEKILITI